jgi:hypothetical protein
MTAYFVGRSVDGGGSWQFVDGAGMSAGQIRVLIPTYEGEPPLPPISRN